MKLSVTGVPQSQGSKSARIVKGRAIMTEGFGEKPRRVADWRRAIADEYRRIAPLALPITGPVVLNATFYLPRPKSSPARRRYPDTKPDLSKLLRAVEDALSRLAYEDDARIVSLHIIKRFALDRPPGVELEIEPMLEI